MAVVNFQSIIKEMCPSQRLQEDLMKRCNIIIIRMAIDIYNYCDRRFSDRYFRFSNLYRTYDEQKEIDRIAMDVDAYYKPQGKKSTHLIGNAADLSLYDKHMVKFSEQEITAVMNLIKVKYPYDRTKANADAIPSAYFHVGTAPHIHLQCNWRDHGVGLALPC